MKFDCKAQSRKELVNRLNGLTGIRPTYSGAPRFDYQVGAYTVERDGTLVIDERDADMAILATLLKEGLIAGALPAPQPPTQSETEETNAVSSVPAKDAPDDDLGVEISLPLKGHTGTSLHNLVNLIYSRGPLISKATGGSFGVDKELIYLLEAAETPASAEDFRAMLNRYAVQCGNGLNGFQILEDRINFTGFGEGHDGVRAKTYMELAVRLNQMALAQKRVQVKDVDYENEKYAMHIFLIRLGMNGIAFKQGRKVLMERLGGSQAFRTPEQAERAKIKNAQKRTELKAQRGIVDNTEQIETSQA